MIQWYVAVRAAEAFRTKNGGRYPGQTANWQGDVEGLKQEAAIVLEKISYEGQGKVDDKYLQEITRFADSKLHTVGAFLGGVASQEAIKMMIS